MMIWHRVLWQLLLLAILTGLPSAVWAQSQTKKWTDKQCREYMEYLFKIGRDPTVDISEVTQHLGIRAGTEFVMFCGTREAKSLQMLEHTLSALEADRKETDESEWRFDRYGKHMENLKSQSAPYDPGGSPGGGGPNTN